MLDDAVDLSAIHRVLVVKLRHHGDVLLASPVFTVLKNRAPHIEIDALVYAETAPVLSGHPAIDQIHTIDRSWKKEGFGYALVQEWRLFRTLRARRYDLLVHLTENPRGAWLAVLLGVPYAVVRDYRPRRGRLWHAAFTHRYRIPARPRHTVEIHLDALRRLGIQPAPAERRLVLVAGEEAERAVAERLRRHGLVAKGFIHVHPTSRWRFKCWEPQKYAALIDALQEQGERVVLTAAPTAAERQFVADITTRLRRPVVDLSGELSLKELAALCAQAKCFVGVDSLPMHIAAAVQTPVVALFGPSGELEWGPWMVRARVLTSAHPCRPCGLDGCGQGKISECLTAIAVEKVLEAVRELSSAG
jgi:heptosyltransferase-3